MLRLELLGDFGGLLSPHSFSFNGENYRNCSDCLLLKASCGGTGCKSHFLAAEGEMDVSALSTQVGDPVKIQFTKLKLAEVSIDFSTYVSTAVAGGDVWCIDSLAVDTTLAAKE